MKLTDTGDLWWKSAVIYCLDVETYSDWTGDGRGDFVGLAHRIDHLAQLGVTCLWLMPFYPTPERDDGYDITDFYGVDRRLGHHGEFVEVLRIANDRGIRVIVDLVVNHTSDKHPWFVDARSSRDSPFRDYYVWRDEPPADQPENVFPDQEDGVWTLDKKTKQYYLHSFYRQQPDLNVTNPAVRDEIAKVIGFWLQLGVAGFRVDAVPFLLDTAGVDDAHKLLADPHDYLRALRSFMSRRSGESILLGEVNLPYAEQLRFFGGAEGGELDMQFDFIVMQRMYLALARHEAGPLIEALKQRPALPDGAQWAIFVRNHDELTLDKLSEEEREEVFAAFGPEPEMQLYGRGLRRRLPPMLDGDPRRIRMVYSLLFALPGTPTLFYGEEIGMGENLAIEGRMAVRTPMQWTSGENGGFSTAAAKDLTAAVTEGGYGPRFVNVEDQQHDPDSLLSFIRTLAHSYRTSFEIGYGDFALLPQDDPGLLVHSMTWDEGRVVFVHNFSPDPATVTLQLDGVALFDILEGRREAIPEGGAATVVVDGYGYRWLRVLSS
ncbi:alpha-amylase family protein [Amnibacterium flavum]|uniref:Alpha-amylase n=1 Tax=Amnibacterium flavum TaxID=2173173 RepID=A0A2V1HUX0_9MICO|nr:alpha-amylase family protein [Amnibacterium flavum]PVZ96101.1 trehalose synthase [Amnibacterium flavum]